MEATGFHTNSQRSPRLFSGRRAVATGLLLCVSLACSAFAQQPVTTSRNDNARSGDNSNETLLMPSNVNKGSFGHLFSFPVDYQILAQPLYVPNVTMPDQSVHNVVYVVTQADSVYAIDADAGTQLWYASMLDGGAPASGKYLPCGTLGGFNQEGIPGTPVIDLTTNTIYLVAKTVLNGTVYHTLHALDITSGNEQVSMGGPVVISAISVSNKGNVMYFNSLHELNRPGLLLLNGVLYMGFGSNGCNDHDSGWVLSYSASNLQQQLGVFNTSPDIGLTSVWHTGNGIAADEAGNVYVSTAESTNYDVPQGGQSYSNSVLKLSAPAVGLLDYFTPWDVVMLNSDDLDVSSVGPLVLPDQQIGPANCSETPCHEVLASGKQGVVYVLDRDNMGQYVPGGPQDPQILQEFQLTVGGELMCSPTFWNEASTVYYMPDGAPLQAFQVTNGELNASAQTPQRYIGSHSPSISANGSTNGIVWMLSGDNLDALDAVSLKLLYSSSQSGTRDKFPKLAHFATQTVADGRVYVPTQSSLEAFGLFHVLNVVGGANQTAQILNPLPLPLQIVASNPYTGQPDVGVTVTFSAGSQGGTFSPASVTTDSNGAASTNFTFGQKAGTYTLTVSSPNFGSVTATEVATPGPVQKLIANSGGSQTGAAGSVLPNPIVVKADDAYKNPVPGVTVTFTSNKGGSFNQGTAVTNALGAAQTFFQLPTTTGKVTVTASAPGAKSVSFPETSVAGPAASVTVTGGNNQAALAGATLPLPLTVVVADQYGNPVSGVAVTFYDGGVGGVFSDPNPATTNSSGVATQIYTLPSVSGPVTITASVNGVANAAVFNETAQ
jgi:hypothetical protein